MIIDKIPTKAFLKCSQSSAAEESDWGTIKVGIVCVYVVYRGREKGRKIQNFHSGDMAFQVYQLTALNSEAAVLALSPTSHTFLMLSSLLSSFSSISICTTQTLLHPHSTQADQPDSHGHFSQIKPHHCYFHLLAHNCIDDIKRAYRQMSLQYHPDVCDPSMKEESTMMFIQLNAAYKTLSDPTLQMQYDYDTGLADSRQKNEVRYNDGEMGRAN
ncbi:hypothetical protein CK203_064244 [Vitis vinifera]|uniref:J domain-containing protein n=1 Tax=Vitis vinifera TaxID=29760 RepID=A0A438G3V0_VITVI|nr:hypothetical protein CK203_064244 [Vitis vinifera]